MPEHEPRKTIHARRGFLALTAMVLAGCTDTGGPAPVPTSTGSRSPAPTTSPSGTGTPTQPAPTPTARPTPTSKLTGRPTSKPTSRPGKPTGRPTSKPTSRPGKPDWTGLAQAVDGQVRRPGEPGYGSAHQLYDPDFDGLRPAGVLTAANADDVATGVAWAVRNGVRVTGRSGGHSYVGASAANRTLVIDVRRLSAVRLDGSDAVVGAGATLAMVYSGLGSVGRVVPGGSCPTVGIAGLTLGGGVGWAVRGYGLTCDRIVAIEQVGADGKRRTVTASDRELFWAYRGGGGGMAGIVTAFRLSTIATPLITTYYARWSWSDVVQAVSAWQRWQARQPAHIWSNLHLDASSSNRDVIVFGTDLSNGGNSAIDSLEAAVGIEPPGRIVRPDQRLGPDGSSDRQRFAAGSDIAGAPYTDAQVRTLADGVATAGRYGISASCIIDSLGGVAATNRPDSAWPWRRAFGTVQWYVGLGGGATSTNARAWIAHMHGCVPSPGGYINYLELAKPGAARYLGRTNAARMARLRASTGADKVFVAPLTF